MPRSVWAVTRPVPALGAEPGDLLVHSQRGPHPWFLLRPLDDVTPGDLHAVSGALRPLSGSPASAAEASPPPPPSPGAAPRPQPRGSRMAERGAHLRLV